MLKVDIIDNLLPVMDMSPNQLSTLLASRTEGVVNLQVKLKSNIVDAALDKVGGKLQISNIPQKE
eukprot:14232447-Ditylum_brightwellii.AAC.1